MPLADAIRNQSKVVKNQLLISPSAALTAAGNTIVVVTNSMISRALVMNTGL